MVCLAFGQRALIHAGTLYGHNFYFSSSTMVLSHELQTLQGTWLPIQPRQIKFANYLMLIACLSSRHFRAYLH